MKKICFVTAARSEYGLLKWLMKDVLKSNKLEFQLVVTGGHLMEEQGHTVDQIVEDGFYIDEVVDAHLDTTSSAAIAASMGRMAEKFSVALNNLCPDYLVVLGDRYELLPICSTAFVMRIPLIHISGGDVTEGAIDDGVRNAVTMLASYHFPGTEDSAANIMRMRGSDLNVWTVGEIGLDVFHREKLFSREMLADSLGLNRLKKWILFTYHAETTKELDYNLEAVKNCIEVLRNLEGYQVVATYANADFGGKYINEILEQTAKKIPDQFIVIPSMGQVRYLSFMKQVEFVMGNSSSGITEAPSLRIPVVNVGDRQKGRYQCGNIIQSNPDYQSLKNAIRQAIGLSINEQDVDYWGDGYTSQRILNILEKFAE